MSSHLNITSSGPGAPRPDELRIELVDKNGTLQDRSMGQTDALKLARWIKLLDAPHPTTSRYTDTAQPAADSSGDPYDIRGKISGDGVPLSRVERETLLAEWGSPFAVDSDVWHMVGDQEDRGEIRVDLTYFPLRPAIEDEKEAGEQEAKRMAQVAESATFAERRRMEEEAKELKKRKEEEVKARLEREQGLKAGVLTVVVHAARELPRGKGAAPFTSVGLVGVERGLGPQREVGKTGTVKKTNNPVWDMPVVTYVEDVDKARLIVEVKDSRDNVSLGSCEVAVRDVVNKIKTPDANDWYKLSKATGKIRLTFKWQPLDIERCHDPLSVIRKEPLGMLKVKVIEAKGVANVEAFRKSDPYMKVRLSRYVIGSTHVRENTLDPQFNEIFYAVCHSKREHLRLELFDFNKVKKNVSLGQVDLILDEIFNAAVVYDAAGQKEAPREDEEEYDEDGNPIDKQDAASGSDPQREQWMSRQVKDGFKVTRLGANVMDVWAPVYIRVNEDAKVEDPSAKQAHTGAIGTAISGTTHVIGTAGTMAGKVGSTALNFVGIGGAKAGQKGHIHFEVELMPVDQDHNVRPLTEEERERERELAKIAEEQEVARFVKEKIPKKHAMERTGTKQSSLHPDGLGARPSLENAEPRRSSAERARPMRPSLEKIPEEPSVKKSDEAIEPPSIKMADGNPQEKPAANEIEPMADVDVTKMDGGAEKHVVQIPTDNSGAIKNDLLHDAGVEEDDDYEVVLKKKVSKREYHACLESPQEVLKEYHAGIMRFRIHKAGRIARPSNYYVAILLDDEEAAHTRISPRSNSPEWEAPCDIFVKNIAAQKIKVVLKESRDDMKRSENDRVVGSWAGDITAVVGQKRSILDLGEGGELLASVGFAPIILDADEEGSKNMGILYVDIVDAANLEAVDAGGSSDPYCIIDLNDNHIHRTAVHKRNLNPEFHESCHANVRSRLRSNLTITVRDHNALAFSKILGTVSLQLARVKPEELLFASLPLQGARGGFLRLRLYFEPKVMDDSAFEKEENDRKEDGRLGKLVKGGAGVLGGTLKSSVEFLAGKHEPKQDQKGIVTAEEMAKRRGAHVRLLDGGRVGERGESHAGHERSESRTEHEKSESRAEHERSESGSVKETSESRLGRERGDSAVGLMAGSLKGSPILEAGSPEAANELFAELIHEQEAHMLSGEVHLTIMAARDLKPVDLGGTSDPYVKVTQLVHGKEKTLLKTHVAKKTLNPVWPHANVVVKVPPSQLRFVIKDWNMFAESKALGEVDVDLAKLLPEGVTEFDAWLSLGLGGTGEIRIKGELRDHPSSRWSLHHKSSKDSGFGQPAKRVGTDAHSSGTAGGLSADGGGGGGSGEVGRSPSPSVDGSRVTFEDQGADRRSLAGSLDRKKYTIFQGRKKN
ncbi:hypothetical protein HK101_001985 [Irineochytrium annulatum]|nr:hypothetical protein HK101_001985 [Irineochytrium annulatum]